MATIKLLSRAGNCLIKSEMTSGGQSIASSIPSRPPNRDNTKYKYFPEK